MRGTVVSINISSRKGVGKKPVKEARLKENHGVVGDVHASPGKRQVSLLSRESIEKFSAERGCPRLGGKKGPLKPGDFAENITTSGINLSTVRLGEMLKVGKAVKLEVSKIGKECHRHCAIYQRFGDCVMPREGIFCRVLEGGRIRVGEEIKVISLVSS